MVRKCKCKNCVYCTLITQISRETSIPRVNCRKLGMDIVKPLYCEHYTTEEEYKTNQFVELIRKQANDIIKECIKRMET